MLRKRGLKEITRLSPKQDLPKTTAVDMDGRKKSHKVPSQKTNKQTKKIQVEIQVAQELREGEQLRTIYSRDKNSDYPIPYS